MKYIQPMNAAQFAEYLLTLKTGDIIEFGIDPGCEWPDEIPDPMNITGWYFAKVMEIKGYCSRFILLDYAGGEEAFAIPLNNFKNCADDDDKAIVPKYVEEYFNNHRELNGPDDYVFVEMNEEI